MVSIKSLEKQVGSLSICEFLKHYCGVSGSGLNKMTHDTVSMFFPNLRRTSYEHVEKNPGMVCRGEIVLVRDSANHLAPYIVSDTKLFIEEAQFEIGSLVEEIIKSLKISSKMSESAVIVIEGQVCLDTFIERENVTTVPSDLTKVLTEVARDGENDGVVITTDGSVSKLALKKHSLEELSEKTDSVVIVLEDDQSITFIEDGVPFDNLDMILLKANLYSHLDNMGCEVEVEIEEKLLPPSSYDLDDMSNFELSRLMRAYKKAKQFDYYYVVKRTVSKRNKTTKGKQRRKKVKKMRKRCREEE